MPWCGKTDGLRRNTVIIFVFIFPVKNRSACKRTESAQNGTIAKWKMYRLTRVYNNYLVRITITYTQAILVEMYHILYNTCVTFSIVIRFSKKLPKALKRVSGVKINCIINLITGTVLCCIIRCGGFSNQNVVAIRF